MIDWAEELNKKFGTNRIISRLRAEKFHGKLTINFAGGSPHTCHVDMCVKAYGEDKADKK